MSPDELEHGQRLFRERTKRALRSRMRTVREALPETACAARSNKLLERLLALPELEKARTVLAFASIHNEVHMHPCIEAAWASQKRVTLPRVVGDRLQLHQVDPDTVLVPGAFSVPEPPIDATRVGPDEVDFALVPALAVDPRGHRIGYGGGYYDKLIPELEHACCCAVAYDFQLIAEVPELPLDVAVDLVVTDARVIRIA